MNRFYIGLPLMLMLTFTACESRSKEVKELSKLTTEVDSIVKMNPVLSVEQRLKTEDLIQEYISFSDKYPEDTLTARYLFHAAMLSHVLPDYKQEISLLNRIVSTFPKSDMAPQALATAARVSEENQNDLNATRAYLEKIKENYPNSPYAVNIDLQIEYVGDDEGLLNAIMAQKGIKLEDITGSADSVDAVKK